MWMQAIREAISLGKELQSSGEAKLEAGVSLVQPLRTTAGRSTYLLCLL